MFTSHVEKEIYHTYLVLDLKEDARADDFGIRILQNNSLSQFLPFQYRIKDGAGSFYYDISSEETLEQQMKKGISQDQLENFARSLLKALEQADEYLLQADDIDLDPDKIYADSKDGYVFAYVPGYQQDFSLQLKDLAASFLKEVDYKDSASVQRVYEFYHLVNNDNAALKNLQKFVLMYPVEPVSKEKKTLSEEEKEDSREEARSFFEVKAGKDRDRLEARTDKDREKVEKGIRQNVGRAGAGKEGKRAYQAVQFEDQSGEDSYDTDAEYEEKNGSGKRGMQDILLLIVTCFAELGVCLVCMKALSASLREIVLLIGVVVLIVTLIVGIRRIRGQNRKEEDEFWQLEDDRAEDRAVNREVSKQDRKAKEDSFQAFDSGTILLHEEQRGVILQSVDLDKTGNLYISNFPATIGKEVSDHSCRIQDPTISRRHARLEFKGKDFYLTDLRSSNGTFLNGNLIFPMEPQKLSFGDHVTFSNVEFIFEKM